MLKVRIFLSSFVLLNTVLLSGCGGRNDNSQIHSPLNIAKKLKSIEVFQAEAPNSNLIKSQRYQFEYVNERVNRINLFDDIGIDQKWNTVDDKLYSYNTCEFSGRLNQPLRDPELEFHIPNPMESSVSGAILVATLGIKSYKQSLCSLGYDNDASFREQEFIPKLVPDNKPFFIREWSAIQSQDNVSGSENISYGPVSKDDVIAFENCSSSVCDKTLLGFQNGLKKYQYLGSDYVADIKSKKLYQYNRQNGQLKTVNIYRYDDTPEIAIANLNRQVKIGSRDYSYYNDQVRICENDGKGIPLASSVNTYLNEQIIQADIYAVGADKLSCSADDYVQERWIYHY